MTKNDENEVKIGQNHIVTVTDMGHLLEVLHMKKRNTECHIKKIDADRYMIIETGEIREYNKSENRSENENSLRQTFKKLRYLINKNFKGSPNELFVTFTFAKDSYDPEMVYKDFNKFIKRLKYRFKDSSTIDYINVLEPHASGQFHSHMLIRFNDLEKIYIPNKEMAELWSHGFVTIKSLKDVDNIGAYVSAYLADIEVTSQNAVSVIQNGGEVAVKEVDGEKKMFAKGGRLKYYPPGMNIFRKSKGIEYPVREEMTYENAQKKVGSAKPHFKKSYTVERDNFENTITIEQYNLLRR